MKLSGLVDRLHPFFLKAMGRLPFCPWKSLLHLVDPRTIDAAEPPVKIDVLETRDGLKRLRFDGRHEIWFSDQAEISTALWHEYLAVFWDHPKNSHFYATKDTPVRPHDVCIDAGACEGFFVLQALAAGAAKVICIEPNPNMAKALRETFADDIAAGRVMVRQAALGAFHASAHFGFNVAFPAYGSLDSEENQIPVEIVTLQELRREYQLPSVDYIKMDIEGAEFSALEGGRELLADCRPRLAITTYHRTFDFMSIQALLWSAGYKSIRAVGVTDFHNPGQYRPVMLHAN